MNELFHEFCLVTFCHCCAILFYSDKMSLSKKENVGGKVMFLAMKEMKYAKLRYGLIIGIMFLIAYVVFMLSGLASGLAE